MQIGVNMHTFCTNIIFFHRNQSAFGWRNAILGKKLKAKSVFTKNVFLNDFPTFSIAPLSSGSIGFWQVKHHPCKNYWHQKCFQFLTSETLSFQNIFLKLNPLRLCCHRLITRQHFLEVTILKWQESLF